MSKNAPVVVVLDDETKFVGKVLSHSDIVLHYYSFTPLAPSYVPHSIVSSELALIHVVT